MLNTHERRSFAFALLCFLGSCADSESSPPVAEPESGARGILPLVGESTGRAFVSAMRSDLNQLRVAQETFYVDNEFVYAEDIGDLTEANLFSPTPGVRIEINHADGRTWDATATHRSTSVACDYDAALGEVDCR